MRRLRQVRERHAEGTQVSARGQYREFVNEEPSGGVVSIWAGRQGLPDSHEYFSAANRAPKVTGDWCLLSLLRHGTIVLLANRSQLAENYTSSRPPSVWRVRPAARAKGWLGQPDATLRLTARISLRTVKRTALTRARYRCPSASRSTLRSSRRCPCLPGTEHSGRRIRRPAVAPSRRGERGCSPSG